MYQTGLYEFAPDHKTLTKAQRENVRRMLAFVYVTGARTKNLQSRHAAGKVLENATGYDRSSHGYSVDDAALADYDVQNHPFVNLAAILRSRGYYFSDAHRGATGQKHVELVHPNNSGARITLFRITDFVVVRGTHGAGVLNLVSGYAEQFGAEVWDRSAEAVA